jgi:methyl-accepting chemotaxis protein
LADHRRNLRNYLVNPRLQLRHVGVVVVLATLLSALLGWLIWQQRLDASRAIAHSLESATFMDDAQKADILAHVAGSDVELLGIMAGVCAAGIALVSLFVVILSHKVAGPLHRVAAAIEALTEGRLPRVEAPRKGDELQNFYRHFKSMSDTLRTRAQDDLAAYKAFSAACAEQPTDGDVVEALNALGKMEKELQQALE